MNKNGSQPTHNYQKLINRFIAEGKIPKEPGIVSRIDVQHDDWCAINRRGICNCTPWIYLNGKRVK